MPVAIRKKSWEDHVTHRSGLQYSYDDLDLVCCHDVGSEGPLVGTEGFKQGRRARCASMPECCHKSLPDETVQGSEVITPSFLNAKTELGCMEVVGDSGTTVAPVFHEGSQESTEGSTDVVDDDDVTQLLHESGEGHLKQAHMEDITMCSSLSNPCMDQSISLICIIHSSHDEVSILDSKCEDGTDMFKNHDFGHDDKLLTPQSALVGEEQCVSVCPDNRLSLTDSAGGPPESQETREGNTNCQARPLQPSVSPQPTAAFSELEPQTDHPTLEGTRIPVMDHEVDFGGLLNRSIKYKMCGRDVVSGREVNADMTLEAFHSVEIGNGDQAECKHRTAEVCGLQRELEGGQADQDHHWDMTLTDKVQGCETFVDQTVLEKEDDEMAEMDPAQVEHSHREQAHQKITDSNGATLSADNRVEIKPKLDHIQEAVLTTEETHCDLTKRSPNDPRLENTRGSTASKDRSSLVTPIPDSENIVAPQAQGLPNDVSSKLDTIHEVIHHEVDEGPALLENPSEMALEYSTHLVSQHPNKMQVDVIFEQNVLNQTACPEVTNDKASPGHCYGNQAPGRASGESPALEVADGHREREKPAAKLSKMEEMEILVQLGNPHSPHLVSETPEGRRDSERKMEDNPVKVRMRKSSREERSRLDSMVLLLMKLDQLDQEIENALSSTASSMANTPTLRRREQSDMDLCSVKGACSLSSSCQSVNILHPQQTSTALSHAASASTSASSLVSTSGTKPKAGTASAMDESNTAEIEAKEACTWLRAAGFPQYAQLYEDGQFPIDITSVMRDHDFLDRDAIEALCRRLNTLNKCALMRLEISPQRKRSEDSDEDEPCAISGRWTFQRDSKRWSRLEELEVFTSTLPQTGGGAQAPVPQDQRPSAGSLRAGHSSESVLTDLSEQPEVASLHSNGSGGREGRSEGGASTRLSEPAGATRASSVVSVCSSSGTGGSGGANEDSLSDGTPPSPLDTTGQFTFETNPGTGGEGRGVEIGEGGEGGKSTRSRAKSFLKRMESLRLRSVATSSKRKKRVGLGGKLEISGPVIKEGLDDDKLRRLNCVDIGSLNLNHNLNTQTLNRNHSVSYSTQTSNGSTGSSGSSQSEASSGSAVSTPSPVTRARSHSTAAGSTKRGGMYLEGFDPFSVQSQQSKKQPMVPPDSKIPQQQLLSQASNGAVAEQNHRNTGAKRREEEEEAEEVIFFYLPEGHKPGTFPKALRNGTSRDENANGPENGALPVAGERQSLRRPPRRVSACSVDSRLSFYDNVPYNEHEEGEEEEEEEPKLEEVLERVSGLQRFVNAWSEGMAGEEEEEEEEDEEEGDSDSALDSASPCPSSPLQNRLEEAENGSDQDSTGNPLGEVEGEEGMRERRDSGVGASLSRSNRPQKLRWPSFQNSHRPGPATAQLQVGSQSVLQMNLLQKLSLLQLTALLEKHTPTNKHGFSWVVPKFMKRIKVRDYKDRNVFGVPLLINVQRTGQPLPQSIQQAMRYLRNQCLDQVGLFRKSGVKSRIQALRQMNEACGADGGGVNYEGQSAYDVADMLKQYFRDLPEPLLTSKLSETFLQIYQYMPKELRLQAARSAVLLLPDESREALHTLLCLLSDVTAAVAENQMTPTNLAVCLAPSLFHLNTLRRKESSSPRVMNRKQTLGKPDQRDLNENLAATHGLAHMIQECRKLFRIPEEMNRCRNSYMEQALVPLKLEELGGGAGGAVEGPMGGAPGYQTYLRDSLDAMLKEAKDKFKGYDSCSTSEHAELAYRKVHDGSPLRLWKVSVEVPAGPEEVLTRVLREQARWDEDLLESRVVETLDHRTEIYQYVRNSMAPHLPRDHLVLRSWVTDLPKGACALLCTSVEHQGAALLGVRTNVLSSRYYIEPCGTNKSRLTHISRTDFRGRFPEWYNKLYGHLCAAEVVRIRESFTNQIEK
ncbi:rho GTPase-activating protein 7 isoform X1 [Hypomesus transpacificus]|uniref:rho GTPase-activating protein 7 isoform X1 n=1 Tax=Hypomesus transpacificus TaxID=137520 RepID=UPI001F072004|nr:rho GTPase-activating protein 7 isoform X1 [Hypomesus transpacificus]XP_046900401.1 rho GTPase-activating protein 7 isoform X1 [Hypomesus transpacificus]XP_046900402.1 rho GTPase-activating protein 7 isoform X1 [Hypomesus transpacificus]